MPWAARLLCSAGVDRRASARRARPSTSAALSPAAPAPTTMQSQFVSMPRGWRRASAFAKLLCHAGKDSRGADRRARPPPAARAAHRTRTDARSRWPTARASTSRRSAGSSRASAAWRSTTSRPWRRRSASAPTSCSAPRLRGPAHPQPAANPPGPDDVAAHPPRGGRRGARLQDPHQREAARPAEDAPRARGQRLALRAERPAAAAARRAGPHHRARATRSSSAPGRRTGSARSTARSSSS